MLHYKHPETLKFNAYMDNWSGHRRHIAYTFGNDKRWPSRRFGGSVGPGLYRTDRDLIENEEREVGGRILTGSSNTAKYSVPQNNRRDKFGVLKGIIPPLVHNLGPGHHDDVKMGTRSREKLTTTYTIAKATECQEALRARKAANDCPAPGAYDLPRYGDDLGGNIQKALDRAVKKGTTCVAASQYTHMFQCMKPPEPPPAFVVTGATIHKDLINGVYRLRNWLSDRRTYENQTGATIYFYEGWKIKKALKDNNTTDFVFFSKKDTQFPPKGMWHAKSIRPPPPKPVPPVKVEAATESHGKLRSASAPTLLSTEASVPAASQMT